MADDLTQKANDLRAKYTQQWGAFRRFIALNPLTGFWCGVGAGFAAHVVLGLIF